MPTTDTATVLVLTWAVVSAVAVDRHSLLFGTLQAADWGNLVVQVQIALELAHKTNRLDSNKLLRQLSVSSTAIVVPLLRQPILGSLQHGLLVPWAYSRG